MKKKLLIGLLAVVVALTASVAIYAGIGGFGNDANYIAAEMMLGCCAVDADMVVPFGDGMNGGSPIGCNCRNVAHLFQRWCVNDPSFAPRCLQIATATGKCPC